MRRSAFDAVSAGVQFRDTIAIRTRAASADLLKAARAVTVSDMKLAWLLGEIRYLPGKILGSRADVQALLVRHQADRGIMNRRCRNSVVPDGVLFAN